MKISKFQISNVRTVLCRCPQDHNKKAIHGVSIPVGEGHPVQVGNTYFFYCEECFHKHTNATNNTVQTVGQNLQAKTEIKGLYAHQVAMTIAKKDIANIMRLKRNGYTVILQGKTIVRLLSPFISNLNGLAKQFTSMQLKDRKVTIITKNANGDRIVTKGRLESLVKDCQDSRMLLK